MDAESVDPLAATASSSASASLVIPTEPPTTSPVVDQPLSTNILDTIDFVLHRVKQNEACFFHPNPDHSVPLLRLWSRISQTTDAPQNSISSARSALGASLRNCFDCVDTYHIARRALDLTSADDLALEETLQRQDAERLIETLQTVCRDIASTNTQQAMQARRSVLPVLSEILKYPEPLKDEAVDDRFCTALLLSQKQKPLKIKGGLLPGLVVLAIHERREIRHWAHSTMEGIHEEQHSNSEDVKNLDPVMSPIFEFGVGARTLAQVGYRVCEDPNGIWTGLSSVVSCLDDSGVDQFLLDNTYLPQQVCGALIRSSISNFGELFYCFSRLQSSPNWKWEFMDKENLLRFFSAVTGHAAFQFYVEEESTIDLTASQSQSFASTYNTICLSWLFRFLTANHTSLGDNFEIIIRELAVASVRWKKAVQTEFTEKLLPALLAARGQYPISVDTEDLLATSAVELSGWKKTDIRTSQAICAFISSDIDAIETAYQEFYRGGPTIGKKSVMLHTRLWRKLCTSNCMDRPIIFEFVFAEFSRIHLLNRVHEQVIGNSATEGNESLNLNGALQLVWDTLFSVLSSCSRMDRKECQTLFEHIGANFLFCMVTPCDKVSSLTLSTLQSVLEQPGSFSVLQALATKHSPDFWPSFLNILDSFRDHCSLGPPLLVCAERIQCILSDVLRLSFASPSSLSPVSKSELWIKSWPFLDSLLSSAVRWAKMDPAHKQSVKFVVGQSFSISQQLTESHDIINTASIKSSAATPFLNTFGSVMQWFRVLAADLRSRSVEMVVEMIRVSRHIGYKVDTSVREALANCCNGSSKTYLSEAEKNAIENALIELDSPMPSASAKRKSSDALESAASKVMRQDILGDNGESLLQPILVEDDPVSSELPPTVRGNKSSSLSTWLSKPPILSTIPSKPLISAHKTVSKQSAKPTSKLAQMRQEHNVEKRLQANAESTRKLRMPSPDHDDLPMTFKDLSTELSPEHRPPKRSIQLLGDDNSVTDPASKKIEVNQRKKAAVEKKPQRAPRSLNDLLKLFLKWDIDDDGDVPPNFGLELRPIPDKFITVQEYGDYFEPLLLLECWEQFKTSKETVDFSSKGVWTVKDCLMLDEFHDLTFVQSSEELRKLGIADSDLVYLEAGSTQSSSFEAESKQTGSNKSLSTSSKRTLAKIQSVMTRHGEATVVARVFLQGRNHLVSSFYVNSRWSVVRMYSLTTSLREYTALTLLPKFLLSREILSPTTQPKFRPDRSAVDRVMRTYKVNQPQGEAIVAASQRQNGFVLIQGPPGTGKTKTILGLVGALLTTTSNAIKIPGAKPAAATGNMKKTRLMICAPSNAACDEIVRRLKSGILDAQGKPFNPKVVRLGTSESISADIRDLTLEELLKSELETDQEFLKRKAENASTEGQWTALVKHQTELLKQRDELRVLEKESTGNSGSIDAKIASITTKLRNVDEKLKAIKLKRKDVDNLGENLKSKLKLKVLTGADVIMCTLSGAGHEILSTIQNFDFPTVIIDEACQSIELSCLIPLRFNVKKCILVGDPKQLPPTVLSPTAQRFKYEQSLFQRIMTFHRENVCLLSIQYRMHPNISYFPALCKAPWHDKYPPYQFLNVDWGREQRAKGHSLYNPDEILACVNFVERLCASFPTIGFANRIGVVTPYKMQMIKLKDKFRERFGEAVLRVIDINTVDAFQGQEKDIIILSTVRAGLGQAIGFLRDKRRMNVALTRAKYSLYVIGRSVSLCNNDDWRALVEDSQARNHYHELEKAVYSLDRSQGARNLLMASAD
ncbi:AAA domain-containing protein [Zopfochytrium polystomum]|nr:AAA domain-containing protein [Zopfochytrium polystomum]